MSLLVLPSAKDARADTARTVRLSARYIMALSITVPTSRGLGTASPGQTLTAQLGSVRVNASLVNNWTATVSATNFTTGGGTPAQTITKGQVSYWSGLYTVKSGPGIFTPGQATAADAQNLSVTRTAYVREGSSTMNSATWNPTLVVPLPATAVAGTYTGIVTHSVA